MFQQLEFATGFGANAIRRASNSASPRPEVRQLIGKFEEFVRRVRRAGLLFLVSVAGLLALSLVQPLGFLLWLIALPLASFASVLSMLWPTKHFRTRKLAVRPSDQLLASALSRLTSCRNEIPLGSRTAFDLVVRRLKTVAGLANDGSDTLLVEEAKRVGCHHLPRLVGSFVALPAEERTDGRVTAFAEGLSAISEELDDIGQRLLRARTDCFEIERQFVENRFPRRDGLASV